MASGGGVVHVRGTAVQRPMPPPPSQRLTTTARPLVAGFHIDDESCSGLLADGGVAAQTAKCHAFFAELRNASARMRAAEHEGAGLALPLRLAVDAGTAWVCGPGAHNCFNMTASEGQQHKSGGTGSSSSIAGADGKNVSVAAHVVALADTIVIMDYDRVPTNVLSRAAPYLQLADEAGKRASVMIGLAIAPRGTTKPAWWQVNSASALEDLMAATRGPLSAHLSFRGFAVFTGDAWRSQTTVPAPALPSSPPTKKKSSESFPETETEAEVAAAAATIDTESPTTSTMLPIGEWYLNHTEILDDTTEGGGATRWLEWAVAHNVSEVYTAPHATTRPLISVPGVEGSTADDARFCDFLKRAATHNISFQFMSNRIERDVAFVRNCSSSSNSSSSSSSTNIRTATI